MDFFWRMGIYSKILRSNLVIYNISCTHSIAKVFIIEIILRIPFIIQSIRFLTNREKIFFILHLSLNLVSSTNDSDVFMFSCFLSFGHPRVKTEHPNSETTEKVAPRTLGASLSVEETMYIQNIHGTIQGILFFFSTHGHELFHTWSLATQNRSNVEIKLTEKWRHISTWKQRMNRNSHPIPINGWMRKAKKMECLFSKA